MPGSAVLKFGKRQLAISNPAKVLYPAGKFTKAQVIEYYLRVSRFILPHLRARPVTLKRFPDGVHGEPFYEKDAPAFTPAWVKTFPVPRREGGPDIRYVVIEDTATLAWAASVAALELHPFLHCLPHIDEPTHIVFDLDPGQGADILACAEVALLLREMLTKLRLQSFAKVSGSKGVQVYVPLNTGLSYAASQRFARATAQLLERRHPDLIVSGMSKNLRQGKVFIDWSQNADHKTTIGVYSLRAKSSHPYVSMPVAWEELRKMVRKGDSARLYFEPEAALKRLENIGDLFAPLLTLHQKLPAQFSRLTSERPAMKEPKSLQAYSARRNFQRTSEPAAAESPRRSRQGSRRRFVIQKHAASHLHYDFRLEMHDVLKSWAVPKGLPLKDGDTRTGFETEDHPIDYLEFEGVIPEGEYGGGTVMVWDIGTYAVLEGNFWKGRLSIFLSGEKLKGEWALERLVADEGKPRWLLRKTGGSAKAISKRRQEISALTGRTLEQIAGDRTAIWRSDREGIGKRSQSQVLEIMRPRSSPPAFLKPMKATAVETLPEGVEWIYEVKWDGYRGLALKHGQTMRLLSLKEKNLTSDFPAIVQAVKGITAETALLDGEIVAVDKQGHPSFQMLQNRATLGRGWQIVYYAFDLLNLEGESWVDRPLRERKAKLKAILAGSGVLYSAELPGDRDAIIKAITAARLEGVIAKQRDSVYRAGTRVTSWVKFKLNKSQEFVIGGYKPDPRAFQSILVGYYEGAKLICAGKVRQGFRAASRASLLDTMRPLVTKKCPFGNLPSSHKSHFGEGITAEEMTKLCWLKPKLVAQVSFTEWTSYGQLRHANFEGLRDDKDPRKIVREL